MVVATVIAVLLAFVVAGLGLVLRHKRGTPLHDASTWNALLPKLLGREADEEEIARIGWLSATVLAAAFALAPLLGQALAGRWRALLYTLTAEVALLLALRAAEWRMTRRK